VKKANKDIKDAAILAAQANLGVDWYDLSSEDQSSIESIFSQIITTRKDSETFKSIEAQERLGLVSTALTSYLADNSGAFSQQSGVERSFEKDKDLLNTILLRNSGYTTDGELDWE
jgi:hypothetical protein